jgi:hypothetical protein
MTGKPVSDEQLARMTGSSSGQVSRLLQELEDSGVFSRTEHGMIYFFFNYRTYPATPGGGTGFLIFWECYPLKVKKPKALAAFLKLKPDRALLDRMLEAIDRQKQSRAWRKDNGQCIPHPASCLNNRQWEDSVQPDLPQGSVWDEFVGEPENLMRYHEFSD